MATSTIKAVTDTGWVTLSSSVSYRVRNGIATIIVTNATINTGTTTLGTLPEIARPTTEVDFLYRKGYTTCQGWITPEGYVRGASQSSASGYSATIAYIAN